MAFSTILRNSAFLFTVQVANPITSLLLIAVISRTLGVEGLGAYSFVYAVQFVASTIGSLGLNVPITRQIAQNKSQANRYLFSGLLVGTWAAAGLVILTNVLVRALGYPPQVETATLVASLSIFPVVALFYTEAAFVAYERTEFIAGLSLTENLLRVLLGLFLISQGFGLVAFFALFTLLRFGVLIGQLLFLNSLFFRLRWEPDSEALRALLLRAPVFASIVIVNSLYARIDTLLLSKLQSLYAVGIYDAAFRFLFICMTIPYSLSRAAYPEMCESVGSSAKSLARVYERSIKYATILVAPVVFGTLILGERFILLLFGGRFSSSVPALQILILGLFPAAVMRVNGSILFASDRQKIDLQVNLIVALASVSMNLVLIRYFSYMGACVATVSCFCLYAALQQAYIRRRIADVALFGVMWRPILASALMAGCVWPMRRLFPAFPILLGACVYFVCLVGVGALKREELLAAVPKRLVGGSVFGSGRNPSVSGKGAQEVSR